VYLEAHHIYPKSIYGKNEILVNLTAKEHYIVHLLLWRGLRDKYGTKYNDTKKMACAFTQMHWYTKGMKRYEVRNASEYTFLKIAQSERGWKHTQEAKDKISKAQKGVSKPEGFSETMSIIAKNRPPFSKEHRRNLSIAAKNKPERSAETRKRLSEAAKKDWAKRKASELNK